VRDSRTYSRRDKGPERRCPAWRQGMGLNFHLPGVPGPL
jgi:hypothetical protein